MTLAILCSGQGGQRAAMFALTDAAPESEALFTHAAELLGGIDPRELVHGASAEILHQNRTAQILCVLQSLAAVSTLREVIPSELIVAGYSVGEISAWAVAGAISMPAALDLVAARAEQMTAASSAGDGLIFVHGLDRPVIEALCIRYSTQIAIAEPDAAFVIGGRRSALDAVGHEARGLHARVIDLPVQVAAHTSYLRTAASAFRQTLSQAPMHMPAATMRLLSGIDGNAVIDLKTGLDKLAAQLAQTVQWGECLRSCVEAGATAFFELGPGHALADMAARAHPQVPARSLDDFRSLSGARTWLVAHTRG